MRARRYIKKFWNVVRFRRETRSKPTVVATKNTAKLNYNGTEAIYTARLSLASTRNWSLGFFFRIEFSHACVSYIRCTPSLLPKGRTQSRTKGPANVKSPQEMSLLCSDSPLIFIFLSLSLHKLLDLAQISPPGRAQV